MVGSRRVFKAPKTASSIGAVPLLPEAVTALGEWKTHQEVERALAGPEWQDFALVFCQPTGNPLHPNNLLKRDFRRLLAKAGLPTTLRVHDLRHTVATVLVGSGVDPKTAHAILRHSRVTTTLGIYAHLQAGPAAQALQHLRVLLPAKTPQPN